MFNNFRFFGGFLHRQIVTVLKILFIFREKGGEGEREGEKHQCERNIDWLPLI